jgi:Fe-S oxidoreductase
MPMVGVDPALVLCYRDEYKQTLGDKRGDFHVMLVHEWLPAALQTAARVSGESWYLFGHCTEVTALPGALAVGLYFRPLRREAGERQRGLLRHGRNLRA